VSDGSPSSSHGVDWIDAGHRVVSRRVQRLASAAAQGSPEELRGALGLLAAALEEQWSAEDGWMEEQG
jgi:hypothetical protein